MMKKILLSFLTISLMLSAPFEISSADFTLQEVTKNYFERLTIVEYEDNSFTDDFIYLAAIPTSVYYTADSVYISSLIYDQVSTNEEYLVQDIAQRWGSNTEIICIGDVNDHVINDFESIATPGSIFTLTASENTAFSYASEIATYFWDNSNTVVLAPWLENADNYVEYIQAASNGAVIASLLNCPLLFVESTISQTTQDALIDLGVNEVILTEPSGFSSNSIIQQLSTMGINVLVELSELQDFIQYIRSIYDTNYLTLIYNNEEVRDLPWTSIYIPSGSEDEIEVDEAIYDLGLSIHGPNTFEEGDTKSSLGDNIDESNPDDYPYIKDLVTWPPEGYDEPPDEGWWTPVAAPGPVGDEDEMPFGPAAYIGAFHAGPIIAFPTENIHCQNSDNHAEYIGDWLYDIFINNWYVIYRPGQDYEWMEDTPEYDDMVPIANEFYYWLEDINADNPTERENVIIVGDIGEIDPSIDRAILGKAVAGRIGTGEGPDAACIINRNTLYPELIKINEGNDVEMSMISYAHDLPFTDNYGMSHDVFESEAVPQAYEDAGYSVNYHTTFDDITNCLSSGVRFWVHVGHGYYGNRLHKPITGPGNFNYFIPENAWRGYERYGSTSDPDQNDLEGNPVPDGEVNPPPRWEGVGKPKMSKTVLTTQWTAHSGNLHSAAMYFLLCNVGGCQMPILIQKSGASVIYAAYTSVSFDGGGQFDIRLNQEIANGATFGDALITTLRETSSIYSEGIQGVDDTLQYIIYGDPSIILYDEPELGWVLPTGHSDPDNAWHDETDAYDDDTQTSAGCTIDEFGWEWTPWIKFYTSCTHFDKIRFYAWYDSQHCKYIDIDEYYLGNWIPIYSGSYENYQWIEKPAAMGFHTFTVRVRFYVRRWIGSEVTADLHEFQFHCV